MGLGITASGEGYASVNTPVNAGGGVGPQTFNLGNLGIGTSGTLGDVTAASIPKWIWYAVAIAAAGYLFLKVKRA